MNKLPLILIPNGGLGNRLRVIDSALRFHRDRSIVILNFKTNMFNIKLNEILVFSSEKVRVWNIEFKSDKVIRVLLFLTMKILQLFYGIQKYNTTNTGKNDILICTCHELNNKSSTFSSVKLVLRENFKKRLPIETKVTSNLLESKDYSAIHIRLGDNARSRDLFDINRVHAFIENSDGFTYVCSDNAQVIDDLKRAYGKKIISDDVPVGRSQETDLIFSIYQINICTRATRFLPSKASSFSTTIEKLRRIKENEVI